MSAAFLVQLVYLKIRVSFMTRGVIAFVGRMLTCAAILQETESHLRADFCTARLNYCCRLVMLRETTIAPSV